jgi:hypothetical protein
MPINKLPGSTSPDPVLYNSSYDQHAVARIAHINEALRLVKASVKTVGVLGAGATIDPTSLVTIAATATTRFARIEAKLDALITALSS